MTYQISNLTKREYKKLLKKLYQINLKNNEQGTPYSTYNDPLEIKTKEILIKYFPKNILENLQMGLHDFQYNRFVNNTPFYHWLSNFKKILDINNIEKSQQFIDYQRYYINNSTHLCKDVFNNGVNEGLDIIQQRIDRKRLATNLENKLSTNQNNKQSKTKI
jgi:hypothetical protein